MSALAVHALLIAAVAAQLLSALGLVVMRTAADRLHYTGMTTAGYDTIATVGLLFLAGPIVVHATARAGRRRELGDPGPRPEERVR
jgi:multisubunit Na+/H+ antiporter MnhG subunit